MLGTEQCENFPNMVINQLFFISFLKKKKKKFLHILYYRKNLLFQNVCTVHTLHIYVV